MKAEIVKVVTFLCMFIVLGMQTLLQGSWKVNETESVRGNHSN
ncbi:hypothetical protein D9V96_008625 [Zobellia laminariae]|nr:hypothetical protein [Zobellia laminariae]WKX77783.1 hypothetical protein Q5W13_07295 [Zobellia laminariae]